MKKIIVLIVLAVGGFFWYQQREKTAYLRDVETPGQSDWLEGFTRETLVERKGVNPDDPVTTIKWTAFHAEDHTAPPLVLSIKKEQWLKTKDSSPVFEDNIGPLSLSLRMEWPLLEEFVGRDLENEPPTFTYSRVPGKKRRPRVTKSKTTFDGIVFASPAETPPEEVILVRCEYTACLMFFEYEGRRAEISFGSHRQRDWQAGYEAAMQMLRSITVK